MMGKIAATLGCICFLGTGIAQEPDYPYVSTEDQPYGKPHPSAPAQLKDYQELIGACNCESFRRQPDGSWSDLERMTWTFKYIMNGTAIQDETLKADGAHSGSIRQFNIDSSRWYVHYYTSQSPTPVLGVWEGQERGDNEIILYRPQKAPNGMEGYFKIRFYDIKPEGFKWIGVWTDLAESFTHEVWKINCLKVTARVDNLIMR